MTSSTRPSKSSSLPSASSQHVLNASRLSSSLWCLDPGRILIFPNDIPRRRDEKGFHFPNNLPSHLSPAPQTLLGLLEALALLLLFAVDPDDGGGDTDRDGEDRVQSSEMKEKQSERYIVLGWLEDGIE
jgi:hypothetical protein